MQGIRNTEASPQFIHIPPPSLPRCRLPSDSCLNHHNHFPTDCHSAEDNLQIIHTYLIPTEYTAQIFGLLLECLPLPSHLTPLFPLVPANRPSFCPTNCRPLSCPGNFLWPGSSAPHSPCERLLGPLFKCSFTHEASLRDQTQSKSPFILSWDLLVFIQSIFLLGNFIFIFVTICWVILFILSLGRGDFVHQGNIWQ